MEELAPDDPLNAFHEIFHRHVAVIMRFGRFPHRNKILQRANTAAEEDFLAEQLVPLRPAAGPAAGRLARLRRHGQEAHRQAARPRVPDPAAGHRRGAARRLRVQVCRTGRRLHQDAGAAQEAGLHPHRRQRPRLHRRDQHGPDQLPRVHRRLLVRALLAPGGLHAGLHHRARRHGQARGRVEQARRQGHRPERRRRRGPRALDRRHQRDAAHAGELPDHRRQGPPGVDAVRHARRDHLPPRGRASARP